MTTGTLFWIVVFLVCALVFFSLAAIITIRGVQDLRSLLSKSERSE